MEKKMANTKKQKVVTGDGVLLHYKGSFTDGNVFDSSYERGQPLPVVVGSGQLIKGFESALIGMTEGQTKTISIASDDAYGPTNPEAFSTVQRDQFPSDYQFFEGAPVQGTTADGRPLFAKVASFTDTDVTLDLNHPLAGKDLSFEIEVVDINPDDDDAEGIKGTFDLSNMTVDQLKAMAKDSGAKGYSKLKKSQLIELLA
jgi:peptidylprolyl isomerase